MRTVKQCNVIKIQKLTSRPKIKLEMTFDLFATIFVNKLSKYMFRPTPSTGLLREFNKR